MTPESRKNLTPKVVEFNPIPDNAEGWGQLLTEITGVAEMKERASDSPSTGMIICGPYQLEGYLVNSAVVPPLYETRISIRVPNPLEAHSVYYEEVYNSGEGWQADGPWVQDVPKIMAWLGTVRDGVKEEVRVEADRRARTKEQKQEERFASMRRVASEYVPPEVVDAVQV